MSQVKLKAGWLLFVALSEAMESFAQSQHVAKSLDATKDEAKIQQAWHDTQILLDALHQEHMSSYLAPYFLVIKSQILLEKDHKLEEAIKVLDEAIAGMSKHSEVTSLFLLKRIKMGFDSVQEEQRKRSLADLVVLTQDTKDPLCEEALYTLGLYYIATGEFEKSQEAFKKLVSGADKDALIPSVWVKQGKEKLVSASDVEIAE